MDKHTHIFNELLFVFCMLSLQDLRRKKQELMDKEKKRQEEKVKKKFNPAYTSNRDTCINIFLFEFCVCQYVHVLVFFFLFFF